MARSSTSFTCQSCGAKHSRWAGRCDACGEWNTLAEEAAKEVVPKGIGSREGKRGGRRLEPLRGHGEVVLVHCVQPPRVLHFGLLERSLREGGQGQARSEHEEH